MARRALEKLSTPDLQAELRHRARQRDKLIAKRNRLVDQVEAIDGQIDELAVEGIEVGSTNGRAAGKRGGRRARNEMSLVEAVQQALGEKPMTIPEVVDAVRAGGYQSSSPNFANMVSQALSREKKLFKRVERGVYAAK
jgi:propanediol dehydratase large subunit